MQRTMLELLNQLDGFSSDERIKVRVFLSICILTHKEIVIIKPLKCFR